MVTGNYNYHPDCVVLAVSVRPDQELADAWRETAAKARTLRLELEDRGFILSARFTDTGVSSQFGWGKRDAVMRRPREYRFVKSQEIIV